MRDPILMVMFRPDFCVSDSVLLLMNIDVGMMCVAIPKAELIDEYQFPASQGAGRDRHRDIVFRHSFPRVTDAARQIVAW